MTASNKRLCSLPALLPHPRGCSQGVPPGPEGWLRHLFWRTLRDHKPQVSKEPPGRNCRLREGLSLHTLQITSQPRPFSESQRKLSGLSARESIWRLLKESSFRSPGVHGVERGLPGSFVQSNHLRLPSQPTGPWQRWETACFQIRNQTTAPGITT